MADNENELNDIVEEEIDDATVMTVPIDDTLSISGEAADAKAVGDALSLKADRTELQTSLSVDGQTADAQGLILLTAEDIPVDDSLGAQTVAEAFAAQGAKTAEDIPISGAAGAQSIAQTIAAIVGQTADTLPMSEDDETTVAQTLESMNAAMVKSVQTVGSPILPDANGNVQLNLIENAQQLVTDRNEETEGDFIVRPTSGYGSVSDGGATLISITGNMQHTGYVPEVLQMYVIPIPRPVPAGITASLDSAIFEAYVEGQAGRYTLTYDGSEWSENPTLYGVTVNGTAEENDSITIDWDGENEPQVTEYCPREADPEITAEIDKAVFRAYVAESGIIDLYYTTEWSEDPENYGITITGTPIGGDRIRINYTKLDRGTITTAMPTKLTATGWNLYDAQTGRARCCRYSETYGYRIGGTYTGVEYAETISGARTEIIPESGLFNVPGDGWLFISGGNATTYVYTTWSDWINSIPAYAAYTESSVDLSGVMGSYFTAGLLKIGEVADEINLPAQEAISRVQRVAYTDATMETVIESGLDYDADTDYIYVVRETPVTYSISLSATYTVNEHGLEMLEGTTLPCAVTAMYGPNLKDKLERLVVTKTMTVNQVLEG